MQDSYELSGLTKKKKRVNGRRKGHNYENTVAKKLNARFGVKEFSRTPGSGAYATTHNLPEYLKIYGDLITPEWFRFVVECKCGYPQICLEDLAKDSMLWGFIEQAYNDSIKAKKDYLVILKQDRKNPIVFYSRDLYLPIPHVEIAYTRESIVCITRMSSLEDLLSLDDSVFRINSSH